MSNKAYLVAFGSFGALLLLGIGLLALPGSLTEEFARSAMQGRLPAIISIPQHEPNLAAYHDLSEYVKLLHSGVRITGAALLAIAVAGFFCCYVLNRSDVDRNVASLLSQFNLVIFFLAISATCAVLLVIRGYEGQWITVESAIQLTANPPYLHRILFPSVAKFLLFVWPALSATRAFMLVQITTLLWLVPAIYYLNVEFVQKPLAALASALVIPLILLTTSYYTFYDYGIILFYSLGLLCLHRKQTALYIVVIALATLNHENILFLILVSGAMYKPFAAASSYDVRFVALQLFVHGLVRAALLLALPVERVAALGNVWINFHFLSTAASSPKVLFDSATLMLWFGVALMGVRTCPPFLRVAVWVLPMLLITTFLVGQINEARQFVAFIPIAIALIAWQMQSLSEPIGSNLIDRTKDVGVAS